jgi:Papain-like cysteine protease AvrRpt2
MKNLFVENRYNLAFERDYQYLKWFYSSLVLPFNIEFQTQSNWCWAATSNSVSHYYSYLSPWTQCSIASSELGQTCCNTPVPSPCNVPWYLDRALQRTNNFVSISSGNLSWNQVKAQLQAGLVVGVRIGWSGGGGHFMIIHGVSKIFNIEYLHIDDPIYGKSVLTYSQFATNYQGSGTWTHYYLTKKYYYFMWFKDLVFNTQILKPIPELKGILQTYYNKDFDNNTIEAENGFKIPHYSYSIKLDEIKKDFKLPETPNSLRIVEINGQIPLALYELKLNEKEPELFQMNVSKDYFQLIDEGLGRLKEVAEKNKYLGEIRLIKVPALNLEAFWLHYSEQGEDIICPLRRFENDSEINKSKSYTVKEFIKILQELSSRLGKMDDTMGG